VAYLENDLGLNVKRVSAAGSSTADADDKDLVIISESVASTQVGDKFKAVAVGVLVMEAGLYDDMEMASPAGFSGETTTLTIVDDTHPLAAGLSAGPVTVYDPQYSTAFGTPSGSAAVVAQLGTDPVIFGYEIADTMLNAFTAPERRVGFFLPAEDNPFENNLTANGLALFDAAVNWAGPYIPSPDFDGDTDVDQIDHGIFEDCATGPDVLYDPDNLPAACGLAIEPGRGGIIPPDLDSDGDVDGSDFAIFQGCISGPGVPFDPTCVR